MVKVLPPMSLFTADNDRSKKKNKVINKIIRKRENYHEKNRRLTKNIKRTLA